MSYKNKLNKSELLLIIIILNMTHLFHGIIKTIITKLICIKSTNNKYECGLRNNINPKKILITHKINKYFKTIVKLNIAFTISNKKMLLI